jgi:hypothetical protein
MHYLGKYQTYSTKIFCKIILHKKIHQVGVNLAFYPIEVSKFNIHIIFFAYKAHLLQRGASLHSQQLCKLLFIGLPHKILTLTNNS